MFRCVIVAGSALSLAACSTTPVSPYQARPAPPERVLFYQQQTPTTTATLTIIRDNGAMGSACFYAFSINGFLAARLETGESAKFFLEPGEARLKVGRDPFGRGLCAGAADQWVQRETILKEGDDKFFRLSISSDGVADVQRTQ